MSHPAQTLDAQKPRQSRDAIDSDRHPFILPLAVLALAVTLLSLGASPSPFWKTLYVPSETWMFQTSSREGQFSSYGMPEFHIYWLLLWSLATAGCLGVAAIATIRRLAQ